MSGMKKENIPNLSSFYVLGIDPSLNGLAAVLRKTTYKDGSLSSEIISNFVITNKPSWFADIDLKTLNGETCSYLLKTKSKTEYATNYDMFRVRSILWAFKDWITKVLPSTSYKYDDRFVAIEGYSMGKQKTRSLFQLGELGGVLRQYCLSLGYQVRVYPPKLLKLFSTGKGDATKRSMREAAESWGYIMPESLYKDASKVRKKPIVIDDELFKHDIEGPGTDLNDAYLISEMLSTEVLSKLKLLDRGKLQLFEYTALYETSKTHSVAVMDQLFIKRRNAGTENIMEDTAEELVEVVQCI